MRTTANSAEYDRGILDGMPNLVLVAAGLNLEKT